MNQTKAVTLFFILLLTSTLGQVASDLYLPALPAIGHSLNASINSVQWSITSFIFGFSISQLVYGPVSDAIGRKKPLCFGLSLLLAGSLICWHAPTIHWMILGRFLQGLGGGIVTIARAMLRDLFSGPSLAKYASYLGVGSVALMSSAPLLGAVLLTHFGWPSIFIGLVLYSLLLLTIIRFKLPETNQQPHKNFSTKTSIQSFKTLFHHPQFIYYALILFASYGGILGYLSVGPVLLQVKLGLTPQQFGMACLLSGIANGICGLSNGRWVEKFGMATMIRNGLITTSIGAISLLYFGITQTHMNLWTFMIPNILFVGGSGFIFANVFAAALQPFKKNSRIRSQYFKLYEYFRWSCHQWCIGPCS